MTNKSALIIMQGVVDHYSMDVAQREAWQTLKSIVLAQQPTNTSSPKSLCESCWNDVCGSRSLKNVILVCETYDKA